MKRNRSYDPDDIDVLIENYTDPCLYQYYDSLLRHRTIIFNSEVGNDIVETVIIPLMNFEKDDNTEPVTLILNTPGGSIDDGLVLLNVIDNYKKPLNIIVMGYACSMGSIILCAGSKNPNVKRLCHKFSYGLIHAGSVFLGGNTSTVKDTVKFNERVEKTIKDYVLANTKITEDEYRESERKEWYLTANDMLEKGMVDEIL